MTTCPSVALTLSSNAILRTRSISSCGTTAAPDFLGMRCCPRPRGKPRNSARDNWCSSQRRATASTSTRRRCRRSLRCSNAAAANSNTAKPSSTTPRADTGCAYLGVRRRWTGRRPQSSDGWRTPSERITERGRTGREMVRAIVLTGVHNARPGLAGQSRPERGNDGFD
ncbi:MAG: hypothetical protein QOE74_4178 [Mycobacterium sp.]|jgi:hypothetical protein|nr:hypothetical protein [Mycobacterium sp.]